MKASQIKEIKRTVFFLCRNSFDPDDGSFDFEEWDMPVSECKQRYCEDGKILCELDDKPCDGKGFAFTEATPNQIRNAKRRWQCKKEKHNKPWW